jgi:ribosomal protein L37AE/L43A
MPPSLRWEPRIAPEKIRRLYETDARGLRDEELLDEVAYALYARCDSIVTVTEAVRHGQLKCPHCARLIPLERQAEIIRCAGCSWEMKGTAFRSSYRGQRLNGLGAIDAFRAYVAQFPSARTPSEKMLLIDRLIHVMHNELADRVQRPAAVNLIEGNVRTIIALLEELAYGTESTPGLGNARAGWQAIREAQAAGQRTPPHG